MTDRPAQPGYDALADEYHDAFPKPFYAAHERRAVDAFCDLVREAGLDGTVIDVGSGTGIVTAYLADGGLEVEGVEPSREMLAIAQREHRRLRFRRGDARLDGVDLASASGIMARYSLIHVKPDDVRAILADWARRARPGTTLLVATQSSDAPGVREFDHHVARAWRWHPDALAAAIRAAGWDEVWRVVGRPDLDHRFPGVHVAARLAATEIRETV